MPVNYDDRVTCVIMGGGQGSRLFPLTKDRAKPAVPLGGKYRLIDIPISNCINSGLKRIYVLTQFNSTSLHRHILQSYHFDRFSRGFVEILAAQQTPLTNESSSWYQGTADAVRKNLTRFRESASAEILILSGDQIYQMDYSELLATHRGRGGRPPAQATIAALLVPKERVGSLGILQIDDGGTVRRFVEKPKPGDPIVDSLAAPAKMVEEFGLPADQGPWFLANMGIYVFGKDVLDEALSDEEDIDFGRQVIPKIIDQVPVRAHLFLGYWEDIGTIPSFLEANLELASSRPSFDFHSPDHPIYTRARLLPATRARRIAAADSLIAEGSQIGEATVERSLIGIRSLIGSGVTIRNTYVMGNDEYPTEEMRREFRAQGIPDVGIGDGSIIENAIIDKGAHIGRNVEIRNLEGRQEYQDGLIYIREGVVVVPRKGVVPDGYKI